MPTSFHQWWAIFGYYSLVLNWPEGLPLFDEVSHFPSTDFNAILLFSNCFYYAYMTHIFQMQININNSRPLKYWEMHFRNFSLNKCTPPLHLFTILKFCCKSMVIGAVLIHKPGNKCSTYFQGITVCYSLVLVKIV